MGLGKSILYEVYVMAWNTTQWNFKGPIRHAVLCSISNVCWGLKDGGVAQEVVFAAPDLRHPTKGPGRLNLSQI